MKPLQPLLLVSLAMLPPGFGRTPPPIAQLPPPEVSVIQPLRRKVLEHRVFTGNVEAVHEVEIKARVSGFVTAVHFTDGQAVTEGNMLFTIDERPYTIARDSATAAMLAAAKAQLAQAELDLSFCRVTSPVTGRVSRRFVDVGVLVSGTEASATRLTAVASITPVYVVFDAQEKAVILARTRAMEKVAGTDEPPTEWQHIKDLEIPVGVHRGVCQAAGSRGCAAL